jgi:type IV pilus assembly protein PilA
MSTKQITGAKLQKNKKGGKTEREMKSLMKGIHGGEKGFTLIELLIVVAILGIIAAVVIPNLGAFMTTGKLSAANSEVENVKTAELAYYAENEAWPADSSSLTAFLAGNLTGSYTFDTGYGWVMTGSGWTGLNWQAGVSGVNGSHGKWIR